ncbi:MAG: type III ribulose-bisphosphate carboxylase [Nanoarchaeota archaeon]|nr:type III ribulose-bisphosphate carboxylase [Nanoarchaeota archaeon]
MNLLDYINLKYKPKKTDLVCEFYVEANGVSFEESAENIAGESSIGTWTDLSTMNEKIAHQLKPKVFYLNEKENIIKVAYPEELFEPGNMPQILSSIAGNIYGMKILKNLRLEDITFTKKLLESFPGPEFGIAGIRKLLKEKDRPLIGTIVKPKVGLNEKQHADIAYEAWVGGLDIVKDDENLSSMSFNNFYERIRQTLKARDMAEVKTGHKKIYMPNVTSETMEMLKRARFVKANGGEYVMIDILTAGYASLQTLRNANLGLVIHAHRAGHAALTRNHQHGISMLAIAKIARLIGVDQLHIGTAVGKMDGAAIEVEAIKNEIEAKFVHEKKKQHILEQKWGNIKPVFAVCSGGLHPGMTAELVKIMGKNIIAQYGGGCHGHPDGTRAGATSIQQAVEAVMKKKSLPEYAKTHEELAKALELWGCL